MSSHHFVREGQEPALYIHDAIAFNFVAPLLEWAPMVITRSSVLDEVLSWGIKIDVVIQENDSPSAELEGLRSQMPVRIIRGQEQLVNSLKPILNIDGQHSISIVALHATEMIGLLNTAAAEYKLTILDPEYRWVAVMNQFSKWLPGKSLLKLYPANKTYMVRGGSLKNETVEVVADGVIDVFSSGIFWVG
jgi:hypothetical protein